MGPPFVASSPVRLVQRGGAGAAVVLGSVRRKVQRALAVARNWPVPTLGASSMATVYDIERCAGVLLRGVQKFADVPVTAQAEQIIAIP